VESHNAAWRDLLDASWGFPAGREEPRSFDTEGT
jgi:hypothetical protein